VSAGGSVSFNASGSTHATGFSWDFDDGSSSSSSSVSHKFGSDPTYNVVLTVTGPGGSDVWTIAIHVPCG
jgi:PKD repeat protein